MAGKDTGEKLLLLEAFNGATAADLQAVDKTIEGLQAEIQDRENTIAGLRQLRRMIDIKLNGKPARKNPEKKAKAAIPQPADNDADRDRIYSHLAKCGPTKTGPLAEALQLHPRRVHALCQHEWFEETIAGWKVA